MKGVLYGKLVKIILFSVFILGLFFWFCYLIFMIVVVGYSCKKSGFLVVCVGWECGLMG